MSTVNRVYLKYLCTPLYSPPWTRCSMKYEFVSFVPFPPPHVSPFPALPTPTPETTCSTQKFQWGTNICWGNHLLLFFDRDLWQPFPNTSNDRTAVSNVHVDLVAKWVFFPHPFHSVFHCHLHRGNQTHPHPCPTTRAQPSQAAWMPLSRS